MKGKVIMPFMPGHTTAELKPRDFQTIQKNLDEARETIVNMFMEAVDRHDGEAIVDIANGVMFFRGKRHKDNYAADRERMILIFLKSQSPLYPKYTIREIAKILASKGCPKAFSKDAQADGFSALRRKCKELGLLIKPSRKRATKQH